MKRRWMQQLLLVGFLLGIYHGRIAVWRAPDPEPIKVFPYYAAVLPSQMREALQKGLRVEPGTDLYALVENMVR